MKPIMIACLVIVCASPSSFGATSCRIVEYPDRSELICVGDEKAKPESIVPATPAQSTTVETLAQNRVPQPQKSETAASSVETAQQPLAPTPSGTASQQIINTPAAASNKAADRLAKRRELAERNTRDLRGNASTTAPAGK